jgi:hypothetical protein
MLRYKAMTSFNLEDAIQFRTYLERCREIYRHEWESVRQRWQDLQYTWRDSQYRNFEPDFQRLVHTHDNILDDLEQQLQSLDRAINVIDRMKDNLTHLDSTSTITFSESTAPSSVSKQTNISTNSPNITVQEANSVITDYLANLYRESASLLNSFAKNSVTYLIVGLEIIVCLNSLYNTETVKVLEAAFFPETVITTSEKTTVKRLLEILNKDSNDLQKELNDFLIDLGAEQLKRRREENTE